MYWMYVFLSVLAITHHTPTTVASEIPTGEQISDSSPADRTDFAEILSKLSPAKLKQIIAELNGGGNKCYQKFDHASNQVIQPTNSINNGAKFLHVSKELLVGKNAVDCVQACCDHPSKKCDLALYKGKTEASQSQCYLFQCYNETLKKNACLFTNSSKPYAIFTRRHDTKDPLEALQETADAQVVEVTTAPSTTANSDVVAVDELAHLSDTKQDDVAVEKQEEKEKPIESTTTLLSTSTTTTVVANKTAMEEVVFVEVPDEADTAILPLALGLAVTMMVLVMVICRIHIMKKKLKQGRGKYMKMKMDESDYLINGMYL